jgi:hypothetical protein
MGEEYLARDTRLGRDVAIKVLPPDLAAEDGGRRRFQHMGDVKVELQEIEEALDAAGRAAAPARDRSHRRLWLPVGLSGALLASLASWCTWRRHTFVEMKAPQLVPLTVFNGVESHPALSPDGEQVAFSWEGEQVPGRQRPTNHIWLKLVGGSEVRALRSGTGTTSSQAGRPTADRSRFCAGR